MLRQVLRYALADKVRSVGTALGYLTSIKCLLE